MQKIIHTIIIALFLRLLPTVEQHTWLMSPLKKIKVSKKLFFDDLAPAFLPVALHYGTKVSPETIIKVEFFFLSKDECPFPFGKLLVEQNRWYSHSSKIKKCAQRQNTMGRWRHWYCSKRLLVKIFLGPNWIFSHRIIFLSHVKISV